MTPGTPFAGCYTVNLATPDSNGADWVADYWHAGAPYGIQLQIGSHAFRTEHDLADPVPPFLVELVNDQVRLRTTTCSSSYYNLPTDGWQIEHIFVAARRSDAAAALTSTALTGVPPMPSQWQQMVRPR